MSKMGGTRSNQATPAPGRRSGGLSPEVKELLHMLQAIEEHPDAAAKDDDEPS